MDSIDTTSEIIIGQFKTTQGKWHRVSKQKNRARNRVKNGKFPSKPKGHPKYAQTGVNDKLQTFTTI
tara:strand:- start:598 stop:798 length:201 start_codon:yes stop_codon:yes gene_type:complete